MHLDLVTICAIWILGFGGASLILKERIARWAKSWHLPRIVVFYMLAMPLVLVEEFLTCEKPFFECIAVTVPAFALFLLLFYAFERVVRFEYRSLALSFGLLGWFNEFILVGRIHMYTPGIIVLFSVLSVLIYATIVIVPGYFLTTSRSS